MRITTKITLGYAILTTLMAGLVLYQFLAIHHMQSINRTLSRVNFRASLSALELLRDRDLVEEYAKKYFVLGDPQYAAPLRDFREDFQTTLKDVQINGRSQKEQAEIARLLQFWRDFAEDLAREQVKVPPGGFAEFPPALASHLDRLRVQTRSVYQATLAAIESEVDVSRETGRQAERITWLVAALVLVVSCLVSFFVARSIWKPLGQLTEGTRRIAKGQFYYRLDTSGNDEFSQLAKDFNAMTHRLSELDEMKQDFVSHVSHELKAPLASIRETIQLLLEELPGPLTGKQRRLLDLNLQSSRRLSSMIGNLLDLSRMEAGVMEYELRDKDLVSLVRTVVAEFEPQAGEKRLCLQAALPEQPLITHCDSDRIIQVLGNVLGNAIKFSPNGAEIIIRAFCAAKLPARLPESWRPVVPGLPGIQKYVLVSIADSGPGVPDEFKEKIFEKFQQAKRTKGLSGQGVGLGLAICRTIIQAHHGAIWVEDNPGGGSVFFLLLSAAEGGEETTRSASLPI